MHKERNLSEIRKFFVRQLDIYAKERFFPHVFDVISSARSSRISETYKLVKTFNDVFVEAESSRFFEN